MSDQRCQHYFIRDDNNAPYACVAILPIDFQAGIVCRGISICSDGDRWNKKAARGRAISRALKADATGASSLQCRNAKHPAVSSFLHQHGNEYCQQVSDEIAVVFKSAVHAPATEREKRILSFMAQKIDSGTQAE